MITKPITSAQLKAIHTLLNKQGLAVNKKELVYSFSNGRTESSKELTLTEAKNLIQYLKDSDVCSDIIKRIWHLGYLSGIIYGDSAEDKAMNAAKLNMFVMQRGTVKKALHQQTVKELNRTVKQFEAIISKAHEKDCMERYIKLAKEGIRDMIAIEDYEGAEHNRLCIEHVKKTPALAVRYFKEMEKENVTA